MNSKETAEILNLPERFISGVWTLLDQLNSTKRRIDISSFRKTSKTVFQFFLEVINSVSVHFFVSVFIFITLFRTWLLTKA